MSDVVCICRCNCLCQRDIRQRFRHQRSLLFQYRICLFGSPHLQARRRQQRTGAADTMAKSCLGGRVKRSILFHILLTKEPSLVAGLSQTALGGNRNPEESGVNTGIPAHRNSCKQFLWLRKKTEIPATATSGGSRHWQSIALTTGALMSPLLLGRPSVVPQRCCADCHCPRHRRRLPPRPS